MAQEKKRVKQARTAEIIAHLKAAYPDAHCELNFSDPLELLIATILSAQCTDKRVNLVTADLFKRYRSAADYASAPRAQLEAEIKTTGFFRNKAKSIQSCCSALIEEHGGEVPRSMEELIRLGGVGRKTANVVLGNAFGISSGIVVDTHVARLSHRLGLTRQVDPGKIEQDLIALVPLGEWTLFSHLLIWHGRRRCTARNPDCAHCEVLALCPRIGVKESRASKADLVKTMRSQPKHTSPDRWLLLRSGLREPAFNMALDEALLERMPAIGRPILRFYGWTHPAATFGYFQHYAQLEQWTPLRPLLRRPTGGGLVPHDADWTYSVTVPTTHWWYGLSAIDSYRRIHEWIAAALGILGIDAQLAPCCRTAGPGQCFVGYEQFDVLSGGQKIAGAAQRRRKDGLLIQGSVQPAAKLFPARLQWEQAMSGVGAQRSGIIWENASEAEWGGRAEELVQTKYSLDCYNQKR